MKNNKGFSLIELIIVISILAILLGITAPLLIRYVDRANKSADVASAKAIAEEFGLAFYSDPALHEEALAIASKNSSESVSIIAYCEAGAESWNVYGNFEDLEEYVNDSVYSRPIKYRKAIDPRYATLPDESEDNVIKYACGSWSEFTPKGWAIAIVDEKPVVFITDGAVLTQGVSPLVCPEYPGAIGEKVNN